MQKRQATAISMPGLSAAYNLGCSARDMHVASAACGFSTGLLLEVLLTETCPGFCSLRRYNSTALLQIDDVIKPSEYE